VSITIAFYNELKEQITMELTFHGPNQDILLLDQKTMKQLNDLDPHMFADLH
jgi:hypothetical protein